VTTELSDDGVLAANAAFYQALEGADLSAMDALWAAGDDAVCVHPGRTPLLGWDDVHRSWAAIFGAGGNPQVILTDERVTRRGPVAWVSATENMLSGGATAVATATNVFEYDGQRWRIVVHHASPIMR
jgi:ketosteroid isomerase-like protein